MVNSSLLIGCHLDGCVPPHFVYPIQVSLKLLIFIHLALNGCFGYEHVYLSWNDGFHPISKGEGNGPYRPSGGSPVSL